MNEIIGINERWYVMAGNPMKRIPVTVVLVAGDVNDYAAYLGSGTKAEADWIAQHGDKISFQEACCHFPGGQLKEEDYRL